MESILEFMYLDMTTFDQKRMHEFLNVANSLEVKVISKNVEFGKENVSSNVTNNQYESVSVMTLYLCKN